VVSLALEENMTRMARARLHSIAVVSFAACSWGCGASADEPIAQIEVPEDVSPSASTKVASGRCWVTLQTCAVGDIIRGSGPNSPRHDCTCTTACSQSVCAGSCDILYERTCQ
jgi:hypothetical protein